MEIWNFIQQQLQRKIDIILLVVIEHQGSSPGRAGFKMAVAADGKMSGSIGGGQAEYSLVEEAKQLLADSRDGILLRQQQHNEAGSGMLCSGSQSVALYYLNSGFLAIAGQIVAAMEQDSQQWIEYRESGIRLEPLTTGSNPFCRDSSWLFSESCSGVPILHIFGAGHVSQALSRIFSLLDFKVMVYADRPDAGDLHNCPAGQKRIPVNYDRVGQLIVDNRQNYVVIMTFAHTSDAKVLQQMAGRSLCYLGMMGSEQKVETILSTLRQQGVATEQLDQIHAPVGLDINSRTAAEIAVSIAAEIIKAKNH